MSLPQGPPTNDPFNPVYTVYEAGAKRASARAEKSGKASDHRKAVLAHRHALQSAPDAATKDLHRAAIVHHTAAARRGNN